jgi:hypothetical protein
MNADELLLSAFIRVHPRFLIRDFVIFRLQKRVTRHIVRRVRMVPAW